MADPAMAERADGLPEQPAELLDRLRLAVVLGEVDVDELAQRRCLDQTTLALEPLERPLEGFDRGLFRFEAAALYTFRAATADAIAVGPALTLIASPRPQPEDLTLLEHHRSLLSGPGSSLVAPRLLSPRARRPIARRVGPHRGSDRHALAGHGPRHRGAAGVRVGEHADRDAACRPSGRRPRDGVADVLRLPLVLRRLHGQCRRRRRDLRRRRLADAVRDSRPVRVAGRDD